MRGLAALSLVALVVLAGCSVPFVGGDAASNGTATSEGATAGTGATNASGGATAGGADSGDRTAPAGDVLGWEGGYWYNDSMAATTDDGFNASERAALVNITMARVEHVRQLEFNHTVPVDVISRADYRNRTTSNGGGRGPAFRTFDNAKFEGLFLVGEDRNSLAVQQSNRGQNVLGFYSPANDSIVVVSSSATPTIDPSTLAHELTHALQDQRFDLSDSSSPTRDAHNARNGLVEGDANYVEDRYNAACNADWQCVRPSSGGSGSGNSGSGGGGASGSGAGGGGSSLDLGVYILSYFPYADGPGFVRALRSQGGWERVNAVYADAPESTEQVIHPPKYGDDRPTNLTVKDTNASGWSRVRPAGRPNYATLGQSGLAATFGATLYDDYNQSGSVVGPRQFLNVGAGGVNSSDPFNYALDYADGWDGDRMAVYQKNNETGYVWKLAWDSPAEAREFVRGYRDLLVHWGGNPVSGQPGVWRVSRNSPYTDAFRITRQGTTVTIVNAPQAGDLNDVHRTG